MQLVSNCIDPSTGPQRSLYQAYAKSENKIGLKKGDFKKRYIKRNPRKYMSRVLEKWLTLAGKKTMREKVS